MTQPSSPTQTDQRLYASYYEVLHKTLQVLPPPLEETPQGHARRNAAVAEQIALLVPASAVEAELAAKFVAGSERWTECLRAANTAQDDPQRHDQLTRQAALMGREARGFLTALHRLQTVRLKREATTAGAQIADMIEHNTRSMFATALADPPNRANAATPGAASPQPPPAHDPAAPPAEPARPAETDASEPVRPPVAIPHLTPVPRLVPPAAEPRRSRPKDDGWPKPDWAAEAERYAIIYPERARLIRRLGGLPSPCTFGPPEKRLLRAIIAGRSPPLLALDGPDQDDTAQRLRCA